MTDRILVVEDQPRVVRLVSQVLKAAGYEVLVAGEGDVALEMVSLEQPDLVLLDVLLPGSMDGYEICRRLREFSTVPVIMLTAKARDIDVLNGFDAGADDYLTKPFNAKELLARVKAVLRRSQRPEEMTTAVFVCGELQIDYARHAVTCCGETVSLTRTEYGLLRELAVNPNRVLSHPDLLTAVWGSEYRDELDYLRAYIRYLRRKIEPDPANPRYIVTLPGVGYMLSCPEQEPPKEDRAV
jgi:two-component system, OmpR family, KDP operon response regulator KdpE